MYELIYTSSPTGLKPGTRGFCTVAATRGLPSNVADRLESLSGYRHIGEPGAQGPQANPINFSHLRLTVAGVQYHVLSRVADAGLDYTQRSNKLAHHIAFATDELPEAGPATLLARDGIMQTVWGDEPHELEARSVSAALSSEHGVCVAWQALTGDAGWARALADTFIDPHVRQAAIIFPPGEPLLPLVAEAVGLLPPPHRWSVTFSTYFTNLPPGVDCLWRFVAAGSPEADTVPRSCQRLIDLRKPGTAPDGPLVDAARSGASPPAELFQRLAQPSHAGAGEVPAIPKHRSERTAQSATGAQHIPSASGSAGDERPAGTDLVEMPPLPTAQDGTSIWRVAVTTIIALACVGVFGWLAWEQYDSLTTPVAGQKNANGNKTKGSKSGRSRQRSDGSTPMGQLPPLDSGKNKQDNGGDSSSDGGKDNGGKQRDPALVAAEVAGAKIERLKDSFDEAKESFPKQTNMGDAEILLKHLKEELDETIQSTSNTDRHKKVLESLANKIKEFIAGRSQEINMAREPLRDMPPTGSHIELPKIDESEPKALGDIHAWRPQHVKLKLIGAWAVFPSRKPLRLKRHDGSLGLSWDVSLGNTHAGTFELDSSELSFAWVAGANSIQLANRLRKCQLEVAIGNQIRTYQLGSPLEESLEFDFARASFLEKELLVQGVPMGDAYRLDTAMPEWPGDQHPRLIRTGGESGRFVARNEVVTLGTKRRIVLELLIVPLEPEANLPQSSACHLFFEIRLRRVTKMPKSTNGELSDTVESNVPITLSAAINDVSDHIGVLTTIPTNLKKNIKTLNDKIARLQNTLNADSKQLAALDPASKAVVGLRDRVERIQKQLNDNRTELTKRTRQIRLAEEALPTAKKQLVKLELLQQQETFQGVLTAIFHSQNGTYTLPLVRFVPEDRKDN